jgi:flagellar motor switch protein FliN/FliY
MSESNDQQLVPIISPQQREMAFLQDIPMSLSIEVGRLKLTVQDFLRLGPESVLDLKKPAGEPFEIAVNGRVIARGEVVMVEQSSGVRVVEVLRLSVTS